MQTKIDSTLEGMFKASRRLGVISEVGPSLVTAVIDQEVLEVRGENSAWDIGSFVLIPCINFAVLGRLYDMYLPEGVSPSSDKEKISYEERPLGTIQLLVSLDLESGSVYPGVASRPHIGTTVFLAPSSIVQFIVEARNRAKKGNGEPIVLSIAHMQDAARTRVSMSPDMLFGRHMAFVGTTGSGKSWSIARMVEALSKYNAKVILLDPTGEYGTLESGVSHVYLGSDENSAQPGTEVGLPYFELTESDLFAIFRPTGQSQGPKLRAAMKSLKLAALVPTLALNGTIIKADKSKEQFETQYRLHYAEVEDAYAKFDITKLAAQIDNECVRPTRSAFEPLYWGTYSGSDQAYCMPLITRIQDIIESRDLAPVFKAQGKASLFSEIDIFLHNPSVSILRISLKYLSFAWGAREIIANAIGRHLLALARKDRFRRHPLLVIVDEAHQFLNKTFGDEQGNYPLDSFALIAKEGRKYALTVCLATQRPRDIPESVLSQMGTLAVHRLINDQDRAIIERASSETDRTAIGVLPTLAPGEVVFLGVDFPVPLVVKIEAPEKPPESRGPDYQGCWS